MPELRARAKALIGVAALAVTAALVPLASAHADSTGPAAPTGLKVVRAAGTPADFDITWNPVDSIDHYNVSVFDGSQDSVTAVDASTTSLHVQGAGNPCTQYRITVTSRDAAGIGATTGYVWLHPLAPGAVTSMVATRAADRTLATATWSAPAWTGYGPLTGYKVQVVRVTDNRVMTTRNSPDTKEVLSGLDPTKQYVVKVWAANSYGTCGTSRGLIGNQNPGSPTRLAVVRDAGVPALLHLTWSAPSWPGYSPVAGYWLGYGDARITSWVHVTGTKFDINLSPAAAHVFVVRAENSNGKSTVSPAVHLARFGYSGSGAVNPNVTLNESGGIVTITTVGSIGSSTTYPRLLMQVRPSTGTGYSDAQFGQNGATTVQFTSVPCGTYTVTVDGVGPAGTAQFARKVVNRCDLGAADVKDWRTTYGQAVLKDGGDEELRNGTENRVVLTRKRATKDMAITSTITLKSGAGYGIWLRASLTNASTVSGYAFTYDPDFGRLNPGYGPAFVLRNWYNGKECSTLLAKAKIPAGFDIKGAHKVVAVIKGDGLYVTVDNLNVFDIPALSKLVSVSPCKFPAPSGTQMGLRKWDGNTDVHFEHTTIDS